MKQDTTKAKVLAALLKRLENKYKPEPPPQRDPIVQMLVSFLEWNASQNEAEQALGRLMSDVVDINDLRISLEEEVIELLGEDYPLARQRVARLREALNEVYLREHDVAMHSTTDAGKKEQRNYLDTLPGVPPYVAAQVTLLCFGGHAMPIDDKLAILLAQEDVVEPDSPPEQVEATMLRLIKADEDLPTHLLLRAWADDRKTPELPQALGMPAGAAESDGVASTSKTTSKTRKKTASRTGTSSTKKTAKSSKKTSKKTTASKASGKKTSSKKSTGRSRKK